MMRARAAAYLVLSLTFLGACAPRARLAQGAGDITVGERLTPEEKRNLSARAGGSAPQKERGAEAEEYFHKETGIDDGEVGGMKGGLPMLLFIALIALVIGAL